MKPHGLALVTAGDINPVDLALVRQFAKARLAHAKIGGGFRGAKQRGHEVDTGHHMPPPRNSARSPSCRNHSPFSRRCANCLW